MNAAAPLVLTLALLAASPAGAGPEALELRRADGGSASAVLQPPRREVRKAPVMIVLHDRACGPTRTPPPRMESPSDMGRLAIGAGSAGDDDCAQPPTAERVADVSAAIVALRSEAPWWNGRAYLVGVGGGAQAAVLAARRTPGAQGVVLVHPSSAAVRNARRLKAPVLILPSRKTKSPLAVEARAALFLAGIEAEAGRPARTQVAEPAPKPRKAPPVASSGLRAASTKDGPEPPSEVAGLRSRPTTGAPPLRATVARVRPSAATPSRPAASLAPRLRARLPAGPSLPPETRPSAPRT